MVGIFCRSWKNSFELSEHRISNRAICCISYLLIAGACKIKSYYLFSVCIFILCCCSKTHFLWQVICNKLTIFLFSRSNQLFCQIIKKHKYYIFYIYIFCRKILYSCHYFRINIACRTIIFYRRQTFFSLRIFGPIRSFYRYSCV